MSRAGEQVQSISAGREDYTAGPAWHGSDGRHEHIHIALCFSTNVPCIMARRVYNLMVWVCSINALVHFADVPTLQSTLPIITSILLFLHDLVDILRDINHELSTHSLRGDSASLS